jgi:hypothetical protein
MTWKKEDRLNGVCSLLTLERRRVRPHLYLVQSEAPPGDDLMRDLKALGAPVLDEPLPKRLVDALYGK